MFGGLAKMGRIVRVRRRGTKNFMSRSETKQVKLF
jgi:hypothetical protein